MKEITITEREKCYLCGRTSKDFEAIRVRLFEQSNLDTARLLKDKETESARLDELKRIILNIDENHKELLIDTVSSELKTYKKIMPGIDKLIQYYRKEFGASPKKLRLIDVMNHITSNKSKEMNRIMNLLEHQAGYDKMNAENTSYLENRTVQIPIDAKIFKDYRIRYEISLCLVCNQIIRNLEKAIDSSR
jgi:hypothetical protein